MVGRKDHFLPTQPPRGAVQGNMTPMSGPNPPPRFQPPQGGYGDAYGGGGDYAGRGAQGFQPHFKNSRFESGSGSNQGFNECWVDGQQGYNNRSFGGEFSSLDVGYYEGGNMYNQA
jgi:hypothetical protein